MQNECTYNISGMHCAACELLVEKRIGKHKDVKKVKADLNKSTVTVELTEESDATSLRTELSKLIESDGYKLITEEEKMQSKINWKEMAIAALIAAVVITLFVIIQKLGIVNLVNSETINLPMVFMIGVVASLSTCMAVVGGLVLSLSSTYAKAEGMKKYQPIVVFHLARLIGFFLLGGVIGIIGSAFTLTPMTSFVMTAILFVVMIIMGINLLDIFPFFRKFQFHMPKFVGKKVFEVSTEGTSLITSTILGVTTFFLPCGFTQSMQLYSLSTGSFVNGALTMFVFALGTLPILGAISFASVQFSKSLQSGIFFKTAGLIVIAFAVFNFLTSLVAIGVIPPFVNL